MSATLAFIGFALILTEFMLVLLIALSVGEGQ